jgi:hypothetical protein
MSEFKLKLKEVKEKKQTGVMTYWVFSSLNKNLLEKLESIRSKSLTPRAEIIRQMIEHCLSEIK